MEVDLKGYLKCTENVKAPDKRAGPLLEHGSTQGAQGGVLENTITALYYTVVSFESPSSICPLLCEDLQS